MSARASRTFRAHLALRLLGVGALVASASAFTLYHWQSEQDLQKSIETIRHFARFIGNESIAINFRGENIVFVEDALRRLSAVHPILYSYVVDRSGRIIATSAGTKSYGPCCHAWEPGLSNRSAADGGDFTMDFRASADGELSEQLKIARGDRIVRLGIPIFDHSTSEKIGTLMVAISEAEAVRNARSDAIRLALLLFGLEFLVGLPATLFLSKRLSRPIQRMRQMLEQSAGQVGANEALIKRLKAESDPDSIREFDLLRSRMLKLHEAIETQQSSLQKAYASASLGEFASQLAHDIRSPLLSLNAALDGPQSTEASRKLVRGAIRSIQEITQGLLEKNRELHSVRSTESQQRDLCSAESLPLLLEKVLSQKLSQFRDRPGLELKLEQGSGTYALFCAIVPVELERIVSNLVNNAAEAIAGPGRIVVALTAHASTARIEVRDTGRGIPAELLPLLGERGLTVGKVGGSGLGLSHASTTLASWGGQLTIKSEVDAGTTIAFELAVTDPPMWFARELKIPENVAVVIADDDEAVHGLWRRRLDAAGVAAARRHHAKNPNEVLAWFRSNLGVRAVYLCDYEFKNQPATGLDLIERLGIAETSFLVTGHADEAQLRSRCEKFGVPVIPKSLLDAIPIEVQG
ncbi:MAG: sensor histidine kinase [Deltaproteobacteria bacterium]|nr:sensor histidine kinase [Deltaproteobacteria bacterium]